MKINQLMTIVLISGMALSACKTAEQHLKESGKKPLNEAELKQLYASDRSVQWENTRGGSGTAQFMSNGSASVEWANGADTGKWRIVNGGFCQHWKVARGGTEYCSKVYQVGEKKYQFMDEHGMLSSTLLFTN
ncbi:MAG: hypothetical protein KDE68_04300 [Rhodocyclaceae bacterium]|nr:hypothetical protein [Rhodocyclaceae bacterium]